MFTHPSINFPVRVVGGAAGLRLPGQVHEDNNDLILTELKRCSEKDTPT